MSAISGPNIVEDGLVLTLDAGNIKSFRGEPTVNLINNADFSNGTTNWSANQNVTLSIENINNVRFLKIRSNQSTSTPGFLSDTFNVSGNTTYTLTIRAYKNDSSGVFLYATGNGTGGSNIVWTSTNGPNPISNQLMVISRTFTTPADMSTLRVGALWSPPTTTSEIYVEYMQIEQKPYATPFVNGTRGTTVATGGGLGDMSGNSNHGELVNGPTFSTDRGGSIVFDGINDYVTIPNTTMGNGNIAWTINTWTKTTTAVNSLGLGSIVSNASGGPVYSMLGVNGGKIVYWTYQSNAWSQKLGVRTINDGNWHMLTWVNYTNYTMDMYVDGTFDANVANSTSGNNNPLDRVGGSWAGYYNGFISIFQITKNKALSASEIQQNYNAMRGRFGI